MSSPVYMMRFPRRYVFGEGAVCQCAEHLAPLGKKLLFLTACGPTTVDVTEKIADSFSALENSAQYSLSFEDVDGVVPTMAYVETLGARVKKNGFDVVIGIGGGKALDIARGQEHFSGSRVAIFPTIAGTNAGGSRLQVLYTDETAAEMLSLVSTQLVDLILLDTGLVVKAPPRSLAAGIGDSLGTYYENYTSAHFFNDYRDSSFGWAVMNDGKEVFYNEGVAAYEAAKAGIVTTAFNHVVEHIVLANALFAGNLRGGMSLPHIIGDSVLLPLETTEHRFLHGELVGYGVIPLLVMKNYPLPEIYRYVDLMLQLGIPVNFEQLGIQNMPREELQRLSAEAATCVVMDYTRVTLEPLEIYGNMCVADGIVTSYLKSK